MMLRNNSPRFLAEEVAKAALWCSLERPSCYHERSFEQGTSRKAQCTILLNKRLDPSTNPTAREVYTWGQLLRGCEVKIRQQN